MSKPHYEDHHLAAVLPLMESVELDELAADIRVNGQISHIVLLDGKILDGRNRYRACKIANVEPRFRDFNGDGDPVDYIVSVNVKRRHLTNSQKALMVARVAQLPRGNPELKSSKTPTNSKYAQSAHLGKTAAEVAEDIDVSPRTVVQAKQVLREASKETIAEIEQGKKSVATAVKEINKAKDQKSIHHDKTGYLIPESILVDWDRAVEWSKSVLGFVSDARAKLKVTLDDQDLILAEVTNSTLADLNNAYTSLKCVIPYAVCTTCQGHQRDKCALCKRRGFISEFLWRQVVPDEVKRVRLMGVKK